MTNRWEKYGLDKYFNLTGGEPRMVGPGEAEERIRLLEIARKDSIKEGYSGNLDDTIEWLWEDIDGE